MALSYPTSFTLPSPAELGIVVARYKEPLDPWVPVAANSFVYAKGNLTQDNDTVPHSSFRLYEDVPNVGREGQTHLTHIVKNYDNLQDVMIFTQAAPFDLLSPVVNTTLQMAELAMQVCAGDVTPFNPTLFHDVDDWAKIDWNSSEQSLWITQSQIKTLVRANYTMSDFWAMLFPDHPEHPAAIRAMHGGIFAVRRETILANPKSLYETALSKFIEANVVNGEVGFMMERMWAPTFSRKYWLDKVTNPKRAWNRRDMYKERE